MKTFIAVAEKLTKKNVVPVLGHIAVRGGIMYASNLEVWATHMAPACIPEGLYEGISFLKMLNKELQSAELVDGKVNFVFKGGKFTMPVKDAEKFPDFPVLVGMADAKIDLNKLKTLSAFCSDDETRPVLRGVYIANTHNHIEAVATDAHALGRVPLGEEFADFVGTNIPATLFKLLPPSVYKEECKIKRLRTQKTLAEHEAAKAKLAKGGHTDEERRDLEYTSLSGFYTGFGFEGTEVFVREIEGFYPLYGDVIPTRHEASIRINAKDFAAKVVQITELVDWVVVGLSVDELEGVNLSIRNVDFETSAEVELEASNVEGEILIGLHVKKLLSILKLCDKEVILKFRDPMTAVMFYNTDFESLLMPEKL